MIYYVIASAVTILLLLVFGFFWLRRWMQKSDADYVLKFIANNPKRASLSIVRNGSDFADFQSDELRPLASTVKIIVAIEYAHQAANGEIDVSERIKTHDLSRYYIPRTDGGAHETWLRSMESKEFLQGGTVSLEEVAKGMIAHSSNANTEYLMMRLGLDRINAKLKRLQLPKHEQIYPIVSRLIIPYEIAQKNKLNIFEKADAKKVQTLIEEMSHEAYIDEAINIHTKLNEDHDGSYKEQVNLRAWHNMAFNDTASKRGIRSTTSEYVSVVQKINDLSYFTQAVQEHLRPIMEWPMENHKNQEKFYHLGGKGGSTAQIVTFALYAEDKQGNKTELAIFFNDVLGYETTKLSNSLSAFQLAVVTASSNWEQKLSKLHNAKNV
ncbi:serine hydrolase [Salicibibacter cibarius]|uniref:serine hydrolase n=1 Tax=Salicibibacter cibarius TaxID=2743000 RepID=UPI001FE76EE1|nr:serine hydrolase [Salicibibacter cibarius]